MSITTAQAYTSRRTIDPLIFLKAILPLLGQSTREAVPSSAGKYSRSATTKQEDKPPNGLLSSKRPSTRTYSRALVTSPRSHESPTSPISSALSRISARRLRAALLENSTHASRSASLSPTSTTPTHSPRTILLFSYLGATSNESAMEGCDPKEAANLSCSSDLPT